MKKMKLSSKAVISLILSAVLFCMPALGFAMNGNYAVSVHAEDTEPESSSEENRTENDTEPETESGSEENSSEHETESSTEEGTVSGNDTKEPECTCEDKCGAYEYDHNCEVCVKDYKLCAYKKPNVTIQINQPDGWHNDKATVTFTVADVAHTGNFEIAKIQAKVGQNGSWTDVTEDRKLEVSENCTVYVQVTDQKGNTYERSRAIKCFDTTKPTLNAAVSDGLLSVQVHDTDSGAKAVYVNGYEFTDLTNGTLNIRLQQFDALESAIPTSESALPNNNAEQENKQEEAAEDTEGTEEDTESTEEPEETEVKEQANPMISYILMGGLAVAVIGGAYYFKAVRKRKRISSRMKMRTRKITKNMRTKMRNQREVQMMISLRNRRKNNAVSDSGKAKCGTVNCQGAWCR